MKKVIFAMLVANLGCRNLEKELEVSYVELRSDNTIFICGNLFQMPDNYGADDDIIKFIQTITGWQLCKIDDRIVHLQVDGNVRYFVVWTVVRALDMLGCDVRVVNGESTMRLTTRNSFQYLDYYLMDDVEIRSFENINVSVGYIRWGIKCAARKVILARHDERTCLEIRCYTIAPAKYFLEVLAVVREKGYNCANLLYPLADKVDDSVKIFIRGEDGL